VLGSLDGDLKRWNAKKIMQTSEVESRNYISLVRKSLSTESNNEDASGDEKLNIILK
jgi:hypothetical protein